MTTDFIRFLKNYKQELFLTHISLKRIYNHRLEDQKLFQKIEALDDNRYCFGDYFFLENFDPYSNYAIYDQEKLIGYIGFCSSHPKDIYRINIAFLLKEEYRSLGLGSHILKRAIKTLFEFYDTKSIYITTIKDNEKCKGLLEKNGFHLFPGYRDHDFFKIHGNLHEQYHYLYTKADYEKNKDNFSKVMILHI